MKSFKDFMEDGAVGSGAAGLQSSGGSPSIPSTTRGVAGAGDDSSTVPVTKKKQYSMNKFNKSEYKRTVPTVPLRARAGRVKEVKEEVKSPRRITSTIRVGEKTAPAQTFMTKEEVEEFKKGDTVYLKTRAKLNSPHTGKIARVTDTHVHIKNTAGIYKAPKESVTKDRTQSYLHQKYSSMGEETVKSQKDIVAANSKTSENPTGAIPKRKKLFSDVRSGG